LIRAGYVRLLPTGMVGHLALSQRCLLKISEIVRVEMQRTEAQEMRAPVANLWAFGSELRSHRQYPQIWYQMQHGRMVGCSFDLAPEGLDAAFERHYDVFARIFAQCGLRVLAVGKSARDFMVESKAGEDFLVICPGCGESANLRRAVARARAPLAADPEGALDCEEFHTPGVKTIEEIARFTGLSETSQIKSLVMDADGEPVLTVLRGDHQLSNAKLSDVLGGLIMLRPATAVQIQESFGASAGSLGPVGVKGIRVLTDEALRGRRNMVAGANRDDYHLRNVTPGEDYATEFFDLRKVAAGDECAACGGSVEIRNAFQLAHVSKLGNQYSVTAGLRVLDPSGKEVAPLMGSYVLETEGILTCIVEQDHDKDGMILPASIAPFTVVVTPINFADEQQRPAAEGIYRECRERGLDALLDDRDERPGVKFKDADLIGIPWRVVVGKKVAQGMVELVDRRNKTAVEMGTGEVTAYLADRLK
jgi:prolyl-tRNA synthetase